MAVCRSYLASLHGANDAVTIGRKLSSLRAFFRLPVRRRLAAAARSRRCARRSARKRLPMFLGKEDVGRLLDGKPPRPDAGPDAARAASSALFEVIYGAGLRISEACSLDVGDIEVDGAAGATSGPPGQGAQGSASSRSAAKALARRSTRYLPSGAAAARRRGAARRAAARRTRCS